MPFKNFKYRLYPNRKQEVLLDFTLEICRQLYNSGILQRKADYAINKTSWTYVKQAKFLTDHKLDEHKEIHSQVLQQVLKQVDGAFQNFFRRCRNKKAGSKIKVGFPRFKKDDRFKSFCYPQEGGFHLLPNGRKLHLSKIGDLRIVLSRPLQGTPKTCRILKDADGWYCVISCMIPDAEQPKYHPKPGTKTGIDMGCINFLTQDNGDKVANPRHFNASKDKLAKEQRRLAKKKPGSRNRKKQRLLVAKVHQDIRNQRSDFQHKLSTQLAKDFELIVFEDLRIQNMVRNRCLARSISDAAWGSFMNMTNYKAEEAGGLVLFVDPRNSSQVCSGCGKNVAKTLDERWHVCPHCGLKLPRDENSGRELLKRGCAVLDQKGWPDRIKKDTAGHAGIRQATGLGIQSCGEEASTGSHSDSLQAASGKQESHSL